MAYIKIKPIKTNTHLKTALDYITNVKKTDNELLVSSCRCSVKYAAQNFYDIYKTAKTKKGNNVAHHICQSFSPEDNIEPFQALEIGKELMKRMYPEYQYVIATHIDKGHIHNHIIVNAVNFKTLKKLHSNINTLTELRKIGDDICRENGLSVIEPVGKNYRQKLKADIDSSIKISKDLDGFITSMQSQNYDVIMTNSLRFRPQGTNRFIQTRTLGRAYTEKSIKERILSGRDIKNRNIKIYDGKTIRLSYKSRLKRCIDEELKKAVDFKDLMDRLQACGYEVKYGKHLAFRHNIGKKFLRVERLGYEYTETMLKLYFEDKEEYNTLRSELTKDNIGRVSENKAYNRYTSARDVNIEVNILNYLAENGINNYEELRDKLDTAHKHTDIYDREIEKINIKIYERRSIIKYARICWQYQPIYEKYREIPDLKDKEKYKAEHIREINGYKRAFEMLERSKLPDGSLVKSSDVMNEIEKLEKLKKELEVKRLKSRSEIDRLENIKFNIQTGEHKKQRKNMQKENIIQER